MEKKIEVEIDGRKVRIMPHMLEDAGRFGATQTKRQLKDPPKELIEIKKVILPPKLETTQPQEAEVAPQEVKKVTRTRTKK